MKCPRCGKTNITPSHLRGAEKILRFIIPRVPYRCTDCWTRFWKFDSRLCAKIAIGIAVIAIISTLVFFFVQDKKIPSKKPVNPVKPVTTISQKPMLETKTEPVKEEPVKIEKKPETHITPKTFDTTPQTEQKIETPVPAKTEPVKTVEPEQQPIKTLDKPVEHTSVPPVEKKTPSHRMFKGIQTKSAKGEFNIVIMADGPIMEYHHFLLSEKPPTRYIIDIKGKWENPGKDVWKVSNDIVDKVRVGVDSNHLRVVLDLKDKPSKPLEFKESSGGLNVTIKK